jgi:hypothetical protein
MINSKKFRPFSLNQLDTIPTQISDFVIERQNISEIISILHHFGFRKNEVTSEQIERQLQNLKDKSVTNDLLSRFFDGLCLKVVVPKTFEEDPGLLLEDHFVPISNRLKEEKYLKSEIKYLSDFPVEYRLTPVPHSRHSELLDELNNRDIPAWLIPSSLGTDQKDIIDFISRLPTNVSLLGLNDGLPIIVQHPEFFSTICTDRALWLSGLNSETSGVGFCLETDREKNFIVRRRAFAAMEKEDIHGLLISSKD